ncbi:stationary phase survival protein SurE [Nautilia sp. PV-1]|uniref:stationary phase survival protein SurE n=1 Tax=Nautilia sp. PV-1 TaxID=2579250 RepID=UPI000FD6BDAB|nr:stationary phase survival protein SurE [Nautilia sp. PV-1]AZV46562.1 stationary phase survival protein SurE [Nautilia sp. PV-1]
MYKKYLRPDISFKILSNYPFYSADIEEDFEKFKQRLSEYDVGVWVNDKWRIENGELRITDLKIFNSLGDELGWEDIVLNYMKSLNTFMREQIGVCIDKSIPRTIDNELTYLIIQRKNKKEFSDMFFVAVDGEVIFPMINKEFDINLAIIKLAEWKNRASIKNLIKFQN